VTEAIYVGNAGADAPANRGWLLGHFKPADDVRHSDEVEIKWAVHAEGDRRADWVVAEQRSALILLVSGRFRVDLPGRSALLAEQEWQIALAVREQARLRALRSGLAEPRPGSPASELLDHHRRAARAAEQSTADRVAALERYAAEVHGADAAYRDWRQHAAIAELTGPHLDLLARTAADEHGIAEIESMSEQARAVYLALRHPRD